MLSTRLVLSVVLSIIVGSSTCWAQKRPTSSDQYKGAEFESKDGAKLRYWLLTPAKIDPNVKYPLVLALHGRGGNTEAATVLASATMRKKYPCFVLAPAVTKAETWAVPEEFHKLRGPQRVSAACELVEAMKKKHPIDADRVYVTGQSMGGYGTFGAIARQPDLFAAAMPVCGGWAPADAGKMKHVALWVFHGDNDGTVPIKLSQQMVDAITKVGGTPKLTAYPGVGHNSWTRTYAAPATWKWLFEQKR